MAKLGADDPALRCLPHGPRTRWAQGFGFGKIVQTPGLIVILYENLEYRQIFLDGRSLPTDLNPSWMGYSVGQWDGDTLVIRSAGFNDRTWLDQGGHPHTEALRITERLRRRDFGHLEVRVTYDDPKAYVRPWTVSYDLILAPDTDLLEYVCAENERSLSRLVVPAPNEIRVQPSADVLAEFSGVYELPSASNPSIIQPYFSVSVTQGELLIDVLGTGAFPLTILPDGTFSAAAVGTVRFMTNEQGEVTHLVADLIGNQRRAVKRR